VSISFHIFITVLISSVSVVAEKAIENEANVKSKNIIILFNKLL